MRETAPVDYCRLVALDLDGTLLTSDGDAAPSSIRAIAEVQSRGIAVVIATSRGPVGLKAPIERLGLQGGWFVSCQGALVARWVGDQLETLSQCQIDPEVANAIEEAALARDVSIGRYVGPGWYVRELDEAIEAESAITGETPLVLTCEDLNRLGPAHKLLAMTSATDVDGLLGLHECLPKAVQSTFSHSNYLEITAAGVSKASGLQAIATNLGLSLSADAIAIGDGANDLDMFGVTRASVAMGNGTAAVKSAATYVTADNDHDGVALALTRLLGER
jgi:Cof subfamily protein (haloacid dehalogenase superfamily)